MNKVHVEMMDGEVHEFIAKYIGVYVGEHWAVLNDSFGNPIGAFPTKLVRSIRRVVYDEPDKE